VFANRPQRIASLRASQQNSLQTVLLLCDVAIRDASTENIVFQPMCAKDAKQMDYIQCRILVLSSVEVLQHLEKNWFPFNASQFIVGIICLQLFR
jgi:hypothetical protein